jgi:hypothetical protein
MEVSKCTLKQLDVIHLQTEATDVLAVMELSEVHMYFYVYIHMVGT